ncbi:MFS transporter [Falsiroseomonas tokyonensis]|uniref:MFS transporter n=1 Tax=Falsiroseomonas tokyonensis TaxID=430521 RepID=A0ABV7BZ64_9PROT|nr:MFS transporter [Falsiroseomonas tokyonensis]MBU8539213.1 MFS transporter [Falsiroseomonas tokyonensis]
MMDQGSARRPPLWSAGFAGLLALVLLGFANLAAFYGLEPWLRSRGLGPAQAGLAIAGFTLVALVLIPPLSARITPATAGRCIVAGFAVTLLALPLYALAEGFPALLALRLLHGLGFVLTLVGIITAFVATVPPGREGEAYALFGVADLLPFALLPPLMELSLPRFGGDPAAQYAAMALLQAPALLLAAWIARRPPPAAPPAEAPGPAAPMAHPVRLLLAVNTAAFLAHALLFSLLKPRALELEGAALVGLFFGLQTATIMALRLLAGSAFDRLDQRSTAAAGLGLVALALGALALPLPALALVPLALAIGLGFGAALPLLNALMHRHSPPERRGANLNLMMLTLQLGYLLGPLLGGLAVGLVGYAGAFLLAALSVAAALPALRRLPR